MTITIEINHNLLVLIVSVVIIWAIVRICQAYVESV